MIEMDREVVTASQIPSLKTRRKSDDEPEDLGGVNRDEETRSTK